MFLALFRETLLTFGVSLLTTAGVVRVGVGRRYHRSDRRGDARLRLLQA
jgi:hypothetical protein